jgi:hypothetical protein
MSEPATLHENWQPGDICLLCSVILVRHSLGGDHRCPDVMSCPDAPGHVHGAGCWLASSFHAPGAPLVDPPSYAEPVVEAFIKAIRKTQPDIGRAKQYPCIECECGDRDCHNGQERHGSRCCKVCIHDYPEGRDEA